MNLTTQLTLTSLFLLIATIWLLRSTLQFTSELDRRKPPTPPRPIPAGVACGSPLPRTLLEKTTKGTMHSWPDKAVILILSRGCEPCDELKPEVFAAIRDYRDFTFWIDGWTAQSQYPRNVTVLQPGAASRELGLSVSPSLVIALKGVVDSISLVNAGGQIEAALVAASRRHGGTT